MRQARYNSKTGEVSTPMDARIAWVDEGDKELHLEMEKKVDSQKVRKMERTPKNHTQESYRNIYKYKSIICLHLPGGRYGGKQIGKSFT